MCPSVRRPLQRRKPSAGGRPSAFSEHTGQPGAPAANNSLSRERYRRIALGASAALGSRAASIISVLASVPLVLHGYGTQRFAIWATLNSFILLLAFSDLGLSHGLVNLLGEAESRTSPRHAARYVSSAFAVLGAIAVCVAALFAIAYPFVDWAAVFRVTSPSAVAAAAPAVLVFAVCFLLNMLLSVAQNVRMAYQESAAAYGWLTLGSILGVVGLAGVVTAKASFPLAVGATCGGPVIAALLSSLTLFVRHRPWLLPDLKLINRRAIRRLLHTGAMFFILQAAAALAYQSDAIVIAQIRGAAAVTKYMIPFRLFAFLPTTVIFALIPFWPAFRSAMLTGDEQWAKRGLRRSIAVGLAVAVPISALLVALSGPLLNLWTGRPQHPSTGLLLGLATWGVLSAIATPIWTFLTGAGALRPLAVMAASMAAANLGLSIVLTSHLGIQGAIYATDICQLVFLLLPGGLQARRLIRRLAAGVVTPSEPAVVSEFGDGPMNLANSRETRGRSLIRLRRRSREPVMIPAALAAAVLGAAIPVIHQVIVVPFGLALVFCAWRWPTRTMPVCIGAAALHNGIFLSLRIGTGGVPLSLFDLVPPLLIVSALSIHRREPTAARRANEVLVLVLVMVGTGTALGAVLGASEGTASHLLLQVLRIEVQLILVLIACLIAGSSSQWRRAVIRGVMWAGILASVEIVVAFSFTVLTGTDLWSLFPFGDKVENAQALIVNGNLAPLRQNAVSAFLLLPPLALVATRLGRRDGVLTGLFLAAGILWLSRGFWAALAVMVVVVIAFRVRRGEPHRGALRRLAPLVPIVLALVAIGGSVLEQRFNQATTANVYNNPSNEFRSAETNAALHLVTKDPSNFVFGLGTGTLIQHPYVSLRPVPSAILENGVLSEWVNGGLLFMLGSALLFFGAGLRGWGFAAREGPRGDRGALGLLALALPILWLEGLVGGTLEVIEPTTILWLLAGTSLAQKPAIPARALRPFTRVQAAVEPDHVGQARAYPAARWRKAETVSADDAPQI